MELTYANLSSTGPVRPKNEDFLGFFQSADLEEQRTRGAVAVIADGVGGQGHGDVASHLAVEAALKSFADGPRRPAAETGPVANLHRGQPGGLRSKHGPAGPGTHGHHVDRLAVPQQ